MKLNKCDDCGGALQQEDNSFTHEFGIHIDKFYFCVDCNKIFEKEEIEE